MPDKENEPKDEGMDLSSRLYGVVVSRRLGLLPPDGGYSNPSVEEYARRVVRLSEWFFKDKYGRFSFEIPNLTEEMVAEQTGKAIEVLALVYSFEKG